jgi:hypothetical protein
MTAELKKSEFKKSESKKSMIGSAILVLLGVLALYIGIRFLVLLVPVAMLVWYLSQRPILAAARVADFVRPSRRPTRLTSNGRIADGRRNR